MHVQLVLTEGEITSAWWATALGIIPLRRRHLAVPLERLRALEWSGAAFPDRLAAAAALTAVLFLAPLPLWAVALTGLGAIVFLLLGYVAALHLSQDTGRVVIPICWWQRHRVARFVDAVRSQRVAGPGE